MHYTSFLALVALPGALAFPWGLAPRKSKANTASTDVTLYAYGTNISGLPVLYGSSDGLLYVAASNTTATGLQSVTWDIPSLSDAMSTSTTATLANTTSPGGMYINVTTDGTLGTVKVSSTNASTGVTTFGQQLIYMADSSLEAKFWAKEVTLGGVQVWSLTWNEANEDQDDAVVVNIKTSAPAST